MTIQTATVTGRKCTRVYHTAADVVVATLLRTAPRQYDYTAVALTLNNTYNIIVYYYIILCCTTVGC